MKITVEPAIACDSAALLINIRQFDKYRKTLLWFSGAITLREDDNGYYYLSQEVNPAECPIGDLDRCHVPKYPWVVSILNFIFKSNIDFDCEAHGNDETHFDFSSLSSIKNEIVDKWGIGRVS
ncbi:Protein of unknown function [Cotesia congregata]|uniref:Uncharacterized protein n=1 Tax=Cotesia congregata TaxID=51543 RepID=A0A8J2MMA1_COTCN|nr:Protein of unknown function [Cotesia congregata]